MQKFYILFLAFFSGMCVMAVELSASRLMAPYFGSSTFIWTNIIGIIMVALSLGYFFGGRLANKKPQLAVICRWIIAACVFLLIVPLVTDPFISVVIVEAFKFASGSTYIFWGSLVTVIILFVFPIMVLGMVSPFLITVLSKTELVGDASGQVFSVSTVGSIIGTFLPVLIFIPWVGTSKTILFFATLLMIIATVGFFKKKAYLILLLAIIPWGLGLRGVAADEGVLYETESTYQYIRVVERPDAYWLQVNQSEGVQSVYKKDDILSGYYYDNFSLLPYLQNKETEHVAILGLAGGVIGKQLLYFHPELNIDGVEIDPKIVDVARKYFDLEEKINVHVEDARIFLDHTDNIYDLIVIDTFANELYIPFHLTTKEFFASVYDHLSENGIVGMNVLVTSPDADMLNSITNSLSVSFDNIYVLPVAPGGFNYLVLASKKPLDPGLLETNVDRLLSGKAQYMQKNIYNVSYNDNYLTLTDDKAPVEYMTDWMIIDHIYN